MSTPGIGDPYWYEWYVGLERIIQMINPDSNISYVIFQSEIHNTIDDVVVGIGNGEEVCFQVKHEVGDTGKGNLTFSKLIDTTTRESGSTKTSLIKALAIGWKEARENEGKVITPVLYTNRKLGINRTTRTFNGERYRAISLEKFIQEIKLYVEKSKSILEIERLIDDIDLKIQWNEFKASIGDDSLVLGFLKTVVVRSNEGSLEELENSIIRSLQDTFKCDLMVARSLFDKLCSNLRVWTTTRRKEKVKVTIEDVYDALSLNNDREHGEHELPYPTPFFKSRQVFANNVIKNVKEKDDKVVWISGDPGSGKTSLISYLQLNHNLFKARYHTFKPISPEQRFYNVDSGLCRPESLWNDLLIQLRRYFKGELDKYNIPVTNALCTVEQMRKEVIRLAELLTKKTGERVVICIDGIDHAARANNEITFLQSLFSPDEIPDGVVFVIVGQPTQLYEQYPFWLKKETENVEHLHMSPLLTEDIKGLLDLNGINLDININILSEFIYEKTQGNNLSVAFAVEEAKYCDTIEDFKRILDEKYVSGDITNYYSHIWKYVTDYLNKKSLGFPFPDKVLASAIILLNGRVNTNILSKAINLDLHKEDWDELLELLFPLVQKTSNNEYALFHNDFRVFLMANNSSGAKYRSIAFQLADYFMRDNYSLQSLNNSIPLLISSERKDLIPEVFSVEFVIHSLANGLSRKKLQEFASTAYQSAIESRDWEKYHSVYLAINTMYQHFRYYEYYEKEYKLQDKSYVKTLSSYELRSVELKQENLDSYSNMLKFCADLLSYEDSISYSRANSTYNLWMKDLTPTSFIRTIMSENNSVWDQGILDEIITNWAYLSVKFNEGFTKIDNVQQADDEIHANLLFNDTYFEKLIKMNETEKALDIIYNGGVSYRCIEKNLKNIIFNNQVEKYNGILERIAEKREISNDVLLAHVSLIINNRIPPMIDLKKLEKIKYITNDTSFKAVLLSIIVGYQEFNKDILVGLGIINNLIQEIEKRDEDKDYNYLRNLTRHGFLLGRAIRESNHKENVNTREHIVKSYKDFMEYETRGVRTFDFNEGFKILLYISLNQSNLLTTIEMDYLCDLLRTHLFERNQLGMHYKAIVLDFLIKNKKNDIVQEYLFELYGKNGEKLFIESNYEETHECFKKYGEVVIPELMDEIDKKLKWDAVSYVDHKEYALWPLLKYCKKLFEKYPNEWQSRGLELYKLSNIADIKGSNRASYDIQKESANAAAKCGITDIWNLRQQDEKFRFSLDIQYDQLNDLVENSTDIENIASIWILSCGILSWYNQEDRIGLKNIYLKCVIKGKEIGNEKIESVLAEISPEHTKIAINQDNRRYYQNNHQNEYSKKRKLEEEDLKLNLFEMKTDEIIHFLEYEQNPIMGWTSVNIAWDIIEKRGEISNHVAEKFTEFTLSRLETYAWEQSGCTNIVEKLLKELGQDFLWLLAEYNKKNLDENDHYYTCSSNMEFLLQHVGNLLSIDFVRYMFDEELKCHYTWLTGCGHLNFSSEMVEPSTSSLLIPKDMTELTFNTLIEQILTRNIHRIEVCLQGLQLLVERYPEIFRFISDSWELFTDEQKEYLLLMSERWSQENIEGFNVLYPRIEKEYKETNNLAKKIQLFLIIRNRKEIGVEYTAKEISYGLPSDYPPIFNKSNISHIAERFLSIMESLTYDFPDDIRYFLQNEKTLRPQDSFIHKASRPGDSMLYPPSYSELDMKILYGEEKKKRWENVPLSIKAQALLMADDPWVISKIPQVTYEEEWDIENQLKKFIDEDSISKGKPYLKRLLEKNVPEDKYVIGGVVWYPIGSRDGIIYTETSKLSNNNVLVKDLSVTKSLNTGGLVSQCISEDKELLSIEEEFLESTGICLTNELVGTSVFIYGNTMVYPSPKLKELLNITPSGEKSLSWVSKGNESVLQFERFVFPKREAIHENYFRQPLMCRWLGDKKKIDGLVRKHGLNYYKAAKLQMMPYLN
ncbi:AAA domain-containing protein [Oceanobacillus limi]|uniref:AAA domain-containing protein n=1 Tax=Oceanobacillus limi TaxID=930131 RepID=A0A1I0CUF1_9BACI|nr:ATP-binding protein [Oceanobacillus limi]SET23450.1 AAA domain-containing protein [Oceanobacillus limi]